MVRWGVPKVIRFRTVAFVRSGKKKKKRIRLKGEKWDGRTDERWMPLDPFKSLKCPSGFQGFDLEKEIFV